MIPVDVSVLVRRFTINREVLVKAARMALGGGGASVSIAVVGDRRMRRLNRDALKHDFVTDVLSFDHGDSPEGRMFEVVVCAPFADRQARNHGVPFAQELARYVVHGCLHCSGHDDRTAVQRDAMWTAQERILRKLFAGNYRKPE
ncbi:MAG: rRNA maturation RNase YbeY [Planctomycetes bacterium]|nr:rRNA maturation RNase YbeY [Planctomycetota bacterium]